MNFMRSSITTILLISITILAAETIHFIDGSSAELKILQVKKNQVYLDGGEKLFIVSNDLFQNKLNVASGKVNFNSYHEIVEISSDKDLAKLCYISTTNIPQTKLKNRSFLYLEISTILNGLNGGVFYEFFFHKNIGVSLGYYKGSAVNLGLLTTKEHEINSFPLGILLVSDLQRQLNMELGFSIEYFQIKKTERLNFDDETDTLEEDNEFKNSLKFGLRYQPELEGVTFKSGAKIFLENGIENLGVYFNLGLRF